MGLAIQIEDKKIRLFGFDAPEKAQLCKNAQGGDYSCGVRAAGAALMSKLYSTETQTSNLCQGCSLEKHFST